MGGDENEEVDWLCSGMGFWVGWGLRMGGGGRGRGELGRERGFEAWEVVSCFYEFVEQIVIVRRVREERFALRDREC